MFDAECRIKNSVANLLHYIFSYMKMDNFSLIKMN